MYFLHSSATPFQLRYYILLSCSQNYENYRTFPIVADRDSLDWKNLSSGEITERVVSRAKPGSIVLFHNAALNTPAALPTILEQLLKNGYKIVPVSELILKDNFTIDPSGMQIPVTKEGNVKTQ